MSPQKSSGIVAPVTKLLSFAKSRLPVANKPKTRNHRRAFLDVAPIPFAPRVDTHAFQPPPPAYTAHVDDTAESLHVPHSTASMVNASTGIGLGLGLGLEGVERGDGGRFDGLGRLSGGFKAGCTSDPLREEVQRMRRRTRACEQPTMRHDVFYVAVGCETRKSNVPARTVKIRIRRQSCASPTPGWERATVSSELKRAASLERRASLSGNSVLWR